MRCPSCGGDSKVSDSRDLGGEVRRRRECLGCGYRFTTVERAASRNLYVIKKDGRREEFRREKILEGIRKACEKRPLPIGTLEKVVDEIEAELFRLGRREVPSPLIGDLVMERLKELDHIAYIRFASVYRQFADLADLKEAVDSLAQTQTEPAPAQLPLLPTPVSHRRRR